MKTIPAIFIIAVATFALANDSATEQNLPPLPSGSAVGRFQLVAATVDRALGSTGSDRFLFRIDTATGRVWRYQFGVQRVEVPGKPDIKTEVEGWVITDEDFGQSLERANSLGKSTNGKASETKN